MICATCKHFLRGNRDEPFGICQLAAKITRGTVWRGEKDNACSKHEPSA